MIAGKPCLEDSGIADSGKLSSDVLKSFAGRTTSGQSKLWYSQAPRQKEEDGAPAGPPLSLLG